LANDSINNRVTNTSTLTNYLMKQGYLLPYDY